MPGFEIERVRFDSLAAAGRRLCGSREIYRGGGRPLTSFCACELRSPAAFTEDGFRIFNQHYVKTLAEWGIFDGTTNPVARSNVCPEIDPPAEPSFYAFSFTRPSNAHADLRDRRRRAKRGKAAAAIAERTVRYRDLSPEGLRKRSASPSARWKTASASSASAGRTPPAAQTYTVHDFHPVAGRTNSSAAARRVPA